MQQMHQHPFYLDHLQQKNNNINKKPILQNNVLVLPLLKHRQYMHNSIKRGATFTQAHKRAQKAVGK